MYIFIYRLSVEKITFFSKKKIGVGRSLEKCFYNLQLPLPVDGGADQVPEMLPVWKTADIFNFPLQ